MLKNKFFILSMTAIFALSFLTSTNLSAQKTKSVSSAVAKAHSIENLPICTEVVPKITKQSQATANKTCNTQTTCVKCQLSKGGSVVYANVITQPKGVCKNKVEVVDDSTVKKLPTDVDPKPADSNLRAFEIIQTKCKDGGIDLEVYVPGASYELNEGLYKRFSFAWMIDGREKSAKHALKCACGKKAAVKVFDKMTKQYVTKSIDIDICIR